MDLFRARPGAFTAAAKAAGVSPATAKKAWETGYPNDPEPRRPIKDLLAEEQEAARARMVDLERQTEALTAELEAKRQAEAKAKALEDANSSRVKEAQMVRGARAGAQALIATIGGVSGGVAQLAVKVGKALQTLAQSPDPLTMKDMTELTRVISTLASAMRQATDAAKSTMEMERLLLGEPTAIVGHVHLTDVTLDEAEKRMGAAMKALERAKRMGVVVEGRVIGQLPSSTSDKTAA